MERDNGLEIAAVVYANRAAKKATPHEQLIDELMDSTIQKTEREQAAAIEIEKNKDRIAAGHRLALDKAIGNGQVPQCAAQAWKLLTFNAEVTGLGRNRSNDER